MGHPQLHMDYQWSVFSHSATWTVSEIQETAHMIHGIVKQHQSTNERKKHEHVFFPHLEAIDEQQLF